MKKNMEELLNRSRKDYIFPFLWVHGEEEDVLRDYIRAVYDANIRAFCIESRPHPDFCGPGWWRDMDIILDEARQRGMKVWILDDSHFPTGYANGGLKNASVKLHRQSVYCKRIDIDSDNGLFTCGLGKEIMEIPMSPLEKILKESGEWKEPEYQFEDDRILSVKAARRLEGDNVGELIDVPFDDSGKKIEWKVPEGRWRVYITVLTRNAGYRRDYINMMDFDSCRILLDMVYEPHYRHYAADFGSTIAGFFSDEPELGNGGVLRFGNTLGKDVDLPWSRELEDALKSKLGEDFSWVRLLWEEHADEELTARVRYAYMDEVTRLVEKDFSRQIGDWCRAHSVEYIGHVIEDDNQHARTGSSLGHYFRGMSGQDMAGIDDIGGQVFPQGEDVVRTDTLVPRDGEFYHFALGKLGASHGAIDPLKKGRAMCEIFGAYGWEEGVRLEKYLADHFMVRGINRFVPHAFSAKKYPDGDAPPHFYAGGHDPLYRHFGMLMNYMQRICGLIDGGRSKTDVAILYHAEAEWTGRRMLMQKPARILTENQIDFHFIPIDVFTDIDVYHTSLDKGLNVNGNSYRLLVIPYARFIPEALQTGIEKIKESGCRVIFLEELPQGLCDGDKPLSKAVRNCPAVGLNSLVDVVKNEGLQEIQLHPPSSSVRCLHYMGDQEIYYFVNEGTECYKGFVYLPGNARLCEYDAWNNCIYRISGEEGKQAGENEEGEEKKKEDKKEQEKEQKSEQEQKKEQKNEQEKAEKAGDVCKIELQIESGHSFILIVESGQPVQPELYHNRVQRGGTEIEFSSAWQYCLCNAINYPSFGDKKEVLHFTDVSRENASFSGFIGYENKFFYEDEGRVVLEITDAYEGVEVFINGSGAGIQIVPPYLFDITEFVVTGENTIRVEVATTLERERAAQDDDAFLINNQKGRYRPIGITGEMKLYLQNTGGVNI